MGQCLNILFISFVLFFLAHGEYVQSPCPENFEYKNDQTGLYGLVRVYPKHRVSSINTKVNFTVASRLPSGYLGRIEPLGDNLELIQQFNNGAPIHYRLHFPVTSPVPQITSITVNDDIVCAGPGHFPGRDEYVTRVGLQHTLFLKNSGGVYGDTVKPVTTYEDNSNFPTYTFINEENNRPWNNYEPIIIINNSRVDERFRPQKPIDFDAIFNLPPREPVTQETPRPVPRPRPTQRPAPVPTVDNNECGININIDSVPLIYNGMNYNRGEWPWVVAIFKRKDIGLSYICSGTLISNRHAITAAHCMHSKTSLTSISDIVVKVGVHNIRDWGDDDITVTRVLEYANIHESYNSTTLANDILLLTFKRTVEFNTYIKAACLWSGNTDLNLIVGAAGVVTGWGQSEVGGAGVGEPRMVRMPIVSTAACRASKPEFHKLTSSKTLCAGDRNGAGPCLGDSGGGLYMRDNGRWKLRGIVSLSLLSKNGDMTCNLNDYIVFTDAAQYLTWISDNMKT